MIETDRVTELICKHKITPTQVYILWLLYTSDNANIEKYIQVFGGFEEKDFKDLESKGLILHTNRNAGSYIASDIVVTLEFAEELAKIDPDEAYEELFNVYPDHLLINGSRVPAKTLKHDEQQAVEKAYKKAISKSKFLHVRVLAAVNKWKEENNGYAKIKIDKFVIGRYWETIEKEDNDRGDIRIY
jgi:hypothetical protein